MSKNKITLLIIFLLLCGFFLRIWKLSELFHFTYDEEIIAFVGKRMFVNHHIPLIGGVTPMHVHLAPYFYWLSGIWLFISRLNPVGWGVLAALIAVSTAYLLFRITVEIFGKKIATLSIILYIFSTYQIIFDRHYWGLLINGFLSLLTCYLLYKLTKKDWKFSYVLSVVLALGFHTDPSTIVLIILSFLIIILFKIRIPIRIFTVSTVIFLISFLPLLIFDLRHDFVNSKGIFKYIEEIKSGKKGNVERSISEIFFFVPQTLSRNIYIFGDVDLAKQYSYCSVYSQGRLSGQPFLSILGIFGILAFVLFRITKEKNQSKRTGLIIINSLFISVYVGIIIYGFILKGDLFDHYLSTIFPLFYIVVAYFMISVFSKRKWILGITIGLFVLMNLQKTSLLTHAYGFREKIETVDWIIKETKNQPFSLDVLGNCFKYNGYRYLFYLRGKEPAKSYVDANFTHLYDKLPADTHPKILAVITNPDFNESDEFLEEYNRLQSKVLKRAKFGKIEAILIDNSKLEFIGKF